MFSNNPDFTNLLKVINYLFINRVIYVYIRLYLCDTYAYSVYNVEKKVFCRLFKLFCIDDVIN